jgi:hypothetical protein
MILEDNVRQLFRRCVPRPDVDRALARFESRGAVPRGRRLVAAAAIAFVALTLWLAVPRRDPAPVPAQDVRQLINDLGSEKAEVRDAANRRLLALGPAALEELDKALYHEIPDVRVKTKELAVAIRERARLEPYLSFTRSSARTVRKRWIARDFKDVDAMAGEAFSPAMVGCRYVPKKTIGAGFKADAGSEMITPAIAAGLDVEPGVVYIDEHSGKIAEFGTICLLSLPDKVGWSAYLILDLAGLDPAQGPRVSVTLQVSPDEFAALGKSLRLESHAGGGAMVLTRLTDRYGRSVLEAGDIVRQLDGKATGVDEVQALFGVKPAPKAYHYLTVERGEKAFDVRLKLKS